MSQNEVEPILNEFISQGCIHAEFDNLSNGILFSTKIKGIENLASTSLDSNSAETTVKPKTSENRMDIGFELVLADKRYLILSEIAQGGMGIIYLATEKKSQMKIAVKRLLNQNYRKDLCGENTCEDYWLREQEIIQKQSQSPCPSMHLIGALKDLTEPSPIYYLLLEYIDGSSLDQWLVKTNRQGYKPIGSDIYFLLQRILIPLCKHLEYIHQQGIVHRDITPKNILIQTNTTGIVNPILIDWGVAKQIPKQKMFNPPKPYFTETRLAATGIHSVGNPPEVVQGYQPIAASDIYMMGYIVQYLLNGGNLLPIPATAADYVLHPQITNAFVPTLLDHLVADMTQYEPADRIPFFTEVLVHLDQIKAVLELPTTEIGPMQPQDIITYETQPKTSRKSTKITKNRKE